MFSHKKLLLLLFSHPVVSDSLRPHGLQYYRLPCASLSPGVCSNSCPLSWWWDLTISSSARPLLFSSCPQSFPASGFFFQWVSSSHAVAKVLELQLQNSPSNEYSGLNITGNYMTYNISKTRSRYKNLSSAEPNISEISRTMETV